MAFIGFSILVLLVKGPHEKGWFGWSGGWRMRLVRPKAADSSAGANKGGGTDMEAAPGTPMNTLEAQSQEVGTDEKGGGGGDKQADNKSG